MVESEVQVSEPKQKKLSFAKLGGSKLASVANVSEKQQGFGGTGIIRRKSRSSRYKDVGARTRSFRWSSIRETLTGKRKEKGFDFLDESSVKNSLVYEAIMSRYNSYNRDVANTIDDMVFVMFDDKDATVDDIRKTADKVIDVCLESESVGVCGTLLEVNDILLFANEQLGFVGETKVRKERRLQAYRITDRILERMRPSLSSFNR